MTDIKGKYCGSLTHSTIYGTILLGMSKREKRLHKVFQNPKTVSFKELGLVLKGFKFEARQPKSGSSHHIYTKGDIQISVPFKRPYVKEVYVKRVLELIGGENNEGRS